MRPIFAKAFTHLSLAIAATIATIPLQNQPTRASEAPQTSNWQPPQGWEPVSPRVEKRDTITIVWLSGTYYEMGVQQGELLKEGVAGLGAEALATLDFFGGALGLSRLSMRPSSPDIIEECRGLSDAAEDVGMTMDACMMLALGDVYQEAFGYVLPQILFHDGCSSFAIADGATTDNRLYHAHSLDNSSPLNHLLANPTLVIRQPQGGIPYVSVTAPGGVVPTDAMNAAGISVSINAASPKEFEDLSLYGESTVQMMAEIMTSATSYEEAIAILTSRERMRANIILVADGNSQQAGVVELLGFESRIRPLDENGVLYATNHFVDDGFFERHRTPSPSTLSRFNRYQQLFEPDGKDSLHGTFDPEVAVRVLRDRVNPETGETTPSEIFDDDATIGGNGPLRQVVFDPERGLFWVASAIAPPVPEGEFTCFSLSELLGFPDAVSCEALAIE